MTHLLSKVIEGELWILLLLVISKYNYILGRAHGFLLQKHFTKEDVIDGAKKDGLLELKSKTDVPSTPGHLVALLYSPHDDGVGWLGDYHWVRRDSLNSWSQKDGGDQVTNFDFAGQPITDPETANWTVNQGVLSKDPKNDVVVSYKFLAWMWVPNKDVTIL